MHILCEYTNMESLLDGTYVINMDKDVARLQEFGNIMAASNWKFERQPAINGKKLLGSWDEPMHPNEKVQLDAQMALKKKYVGGSLFLSKGEIGCMLSHMALWEEVATNPEKNRIAIFEDDARTHTDGDTIYRLLTGLYDYLHQNNIPEPDILYLGKALDQCMNYERVWNNVYKSTHPLCLHAYIITKQGAQKLIGMAPYSCPIDVVPIQGISKGTITAMVFHPSIYFQDIFNNVSNLRQLAAGINTTTECLVSMQHVAEDTWEYLVVILIGLVALLILFTIFIWLRPWTLI